MGNPIVHVEVIGPDPARLREFYAQLFGWDAPAGAPVADQISDTAQYSFVAPEPGAGPAASGIGGGSTFEPHAIFYVGVPDVAEALSSAKSCGATITLTPQRNESGKVTVGHFRDPAGNLVGVAGPR